MRKILLSVLSLFLVLSQPSFGESKSDYPGVADPFADPAQYEFSDEEKDDKEFFHLGRFMMIGVDMGAGIYTGGLGSTTAPGFMFGGHLIYFFDKSFAFEGRLSYSNSLDSPRGAGSTGVDIDTNLTGATAGFRYYIDTKAAPRAIAIANPYLAVGGGVFMRSQRRIASVGAGNYTFTPSTNFGAYAGGGIQFAVYRNHVYLGMDIRYQMVFFPDENGTLGGLVSQGGRSGDYLTTAVSATYSF
jgi:hypothetical protein